MPTAQTVHFYVFAGTCPFDRAASYFIGDLTKMLPGLYWILSFVQGETELLGRLWIVSNVLFIDFRPGSLPILPSFTAHEWELTWQLVPTVLTAAEVIITQVEGARDLWERQPRAS